MKSMIYCIPIYAMFLTLSCEENVQINPLSRFEGEWSMISSALDNNLQEDWRESTFEFHVVDESSLALHCKGVPENRAAIWPAQNNLILQTNDSIFYEFKRNDKVLFQMVFGESELTMWLSLPRELSYTEPCPDDEQALICREEGSWVFKLKK